MTAGPGNSQSRLRASHSDWAWLFLWVFVFLLITLHPFVPNSNAMGRQYTSFWQPRLAPPDLLGNLLLCVPFGLILFRIVPGRRAGLIVAGVFGVLISSLVEAGQAYIALRSASFSDVVMNASGAVLGVALYPRAANWVSKLRPKPAQWGVLVFASLIVFLSAGPPEVYGSYWLWRCDAKISTKTDIGGPDIWPGTVHRAELYAGVHQPKDLNVDSAVWSLARDGRGVVIEDGCDTLVSRDAMTLDVDMTLPPRAAFPWYLGIVDYAIGPHAPNLTLGEIAGRLVLRVGTRVTPIIGLFPDGTEMFDLGRFDPLRRTRLTISFNGRRFEAFQDGKPLLQHELQMGHHNGVRRFWLPRAEWGAWLFALTAGLLLGAAARGRWGFWGAMVFACIGAGALEWLQVPLAQRAPVDAAIGCLPVILGATWGALCGWPPHPDDVVATHLDP